MYSKSPIALLLLTTLGMFSGLPARADGEAATLDQRAASKLSTLYAQLGSDDFDMREKAQSSIQALASESNDEVLDHTLERYLETTDPEVRYRLRSAMFNAVAANVPRNGFIGIRMNTAVAFNRAGQRQTVNSVGVMSVIPGSAAEKFGIKAGDQIIELDGKPFEQGDRIIPPTYQLQEYVGSRTEGTPVKLTIRRGIQELKIDLSLGGMPDELTEGRKERLFADWMHEELVDRGLAEPKSAATPSSEFQRFLPQQVRPVPIPIQPQNLFPDSE